jgi:Glyoxalase/Bleomycin resistance protein/Dioxygenase superfamily
MPQEFCSAILKTTDVAGTIEWYRGVGFEVRGIFPDTGEPTWCEVSRDGVILQFLGGETPWPGPPNFTGTLYFYPESVGAVYDQIKDHTTPAWGPEVREWGARELGLQDPNGYFLTFTSPPIPLDLGRAYGSPSRSIPTSRARSAESSSQSIRSSADDFGRRPGYRSRREQRARDDF